MVISGLAGLFTGYYFQSVVSALACWVGGVFVDADHIFDYYINHGATLNIKKIYTTCEEINLRRIFVLLHSYELVVLLAFFIYAFSLGDMWKGLTIGFALHLTSDQATNPLKPGAYFIVYRLLKGFKKESLVK